MQLATFHVVSNWLGLNVIQMQSVIQVSSHLTTFTKNLEIIAGNMMYKPFH